MIQSQTSKASALAQLLRSSATLHELRSRHRKTASELSTDRFVDHVLIEMYGKLGSIDDAESVFHAIASRNIYSWNFLLLAYAQTGHLSKAKVVLEAMPQRNAVSWTTAMAFFSSSGSHHLSKTVFDGIPERDLVSWNVFLNGYASTGHFLGSLETFHRMPEWSVVSWTTLVTAFSRDPSLHAQARSLFDRAPERNSVLWNVVVGMCAQSGHIIESKALFDRMPRHDLVSWNSLLAGYREEGDCDRARELFRSMPERNVMSWNTMIALDPLQARSFFSRMAMWSLASCSAMLQAFAAHGDAVAMREAREFFASMPQRDALAWTCLISGYAQSGRSTEAKITLDRMPAWDVVSCTAMIHAHVLARDHAAVKELFDSMPERNVLSWNTLLQSAAHQSSSSCQSIAARMPCHSAVSWSIQLASLAQGGEIGETRNRFDSLIGGDPVSWTVMIQAYAQTGHPRVALDLFAQMCVEGIEATEITFVAVLTACAHAGMIEQGAATASRAEIDFGVRIGIQHYHCLVDLLGRAHHLGRAEELVETMPFVPDAYSWTTLLAACSIHGGAGDGAATRAVACDPGFGAPYVLLYNSYWGSRGGTKSRPS